MSTTDLRDTVMIMKKAEEKALLDLIMEMKSHEDRDPWLLGVRDAPPDLKEAYSMLVLMRDAWEEVPEMYKVIGLLVKDLRRRLDTYWDLNIRRYEGKIREEIAAIRDPYSVLMGLPPNPRLVSPKEARAGNRYRIGERREREREEEEEEREEQEAL